MRNGLFRRHPCQLVERRDRLMTWGEAESGGHAFYPSTWQPVCQLGVACALSRSTDRLKPCVSITVLKNSYGVHLPAPPPPCLAALANHLILFDSEGRFHCMPDDSRTPKIELFRNRFLQALRDGKHVSPSRLADLLSWKHSGFHIKGGALPPRAHAKGMGTHRPRTDSPAYPGIKRSPC